VLLILEHGVEIHNKGLLGKSKIGRFCLDAGRIGGNFYFSIVLMGTWALISPVTEETNLFFGEREGRIGQRNVTYKTHVALRCGCSVPAAE